MTSQPPDRGPDRWQPLSRVTLLEALRSIHLDGGSGVLETKGVVGVGSIYATRGALFLTSVDVPGGARRDAETPIVAVLDASHRAVLVGLTDVLLSASGARLAFFPGDVDVPLEAVGPIPAFTLGVLVATRGVSDDDLLELLGGSKATIGLDHGAAVQRLPALTKKARQVVSRLAEPCSVSEVQRSFGREAIRITAALHQLGFVGESSSSKPTGQPAPDSNRVGKSTLRPFLDRIADDLRTRPLDLDSIAHRALVADLVRTSGGKNHYELIGIRGSVSAEDVAVGFETLARQVHPSHAEAIGVRAGVLETLFERAAEAYLTLSDPARKSSYDQMMELGGEVDGASEEEMAQVRQAMAKDCYDKAKSAFKLEDYHTSLESLRDAIRFDPRPEYHGLLGLVQSKNPKWLDQAVTSLKTAIEGKPDDVGFRLALAGVLEQRGQVSAAIELYRAALELAPDHPTAKDAVSRLSFEEAKKAKGPTGWLARLFSGGE